ncbi:MAG TPA: branched-chain amino acid transaminase [Gemmatimonadaceae bacterium]|nr:branched-chain amino acid transaminase [Gemmatimonadaceae bacterium]
MKIWRDGQLIPWADATIHVLNHVVHYGSSIFEGIRCYETPAGGAIFRLKDHLRRLYDSARIYRMPMKHSMDDLMQACIETVAGNDLKECYLRPLVIRTGERMGIFPDAEAIETFVIPAVWGRYLGEEGMERGVDVCVSSWQRAAPNTFPTMAKAGGNYLSSQLSLLEARGNGYAEGIMLDAFGRVSEGSGENVFLVRDDVLYTPSLASAILPGITRASVLEIASDLGYEVREGDIPREMLYVADELFFSGTAAEITPVKSVDRIPIGIGRRGPVTRAIQERYLGIARGAIADEHGWLQPVPETAPVAS